MELPEYRVKYQQACGCEVVILAITYSDSTIFEVSRRPRPRGRTHILEPISLDMGHGRDAYHAGGYVP